MTPKGKQCEFGMLAVGPSSAGKGIGKALIAAAENWARDQGHEEMLCEILKPRTWVHEYKAFLTEWYTKLGYKITVDEPFEKMFPDLVATFGLACECNAQQLVKAL